MMLRTVCVAAAVVACSHASAAEKTIPINFVGDWCFASLENKTTSYLLPSWTEDGHCTKILSIDQYGFHGEGRQSGERRPASNLQVLSLQGQPECRR